MLNADNKGLEVPIDALASIVDEHENPELGFSRADIWALSALVGADVAQPFPIVDFPLTTIGRVNCEDLGKPCLNSNGAQRPCRSDRGPHRDLPHADITTDDLFHFFSSAFGFGVKQTVALLGAHTLGILTRENSGFDGQDGWVTDQTVLDNNYYFELVGLVDPEKDFADQLDQAPPWFRAFEDNSDLPGIPDRHVWEAFPEGQDGQRILMLNADVRTIGLVDFILMLSQLTLQSVCPHLRSLWSENWTTPIWTRTGKSPAHLSAEGDVHTLLGRSTLLLNISSTTLCG